MRDKGFRRWKRSVKMNRRLTEDRNSHYNDMSCACYGQEGLDRMEEEHQRGKWGDDGGITDARHVGRIMSRFADHPHACSCMSCRNPRRNKGWSLKDRLTMQERRVREEPCEEEAY